MLVEGTGHKWPGFAEVNFAILGEKGGEGGLFGKGAGFVVVGREFIDLAEVSEGGLHSGVESFCLTDLPFVDIVCIPGLFLVVGRRHCRGCGGVGVSRSKLEKKPLRPGNPALQRQRNLQSLHIPTPTPNTTATPDKVN